MKNFIFTVALICPALAFGKVVKNKKSVPGRKVASAVDAKASMLAGYNMLQKLSDAGVLPAPIDLQNVTVTMKIEQRGGGYYMFFTLTGPEISNTLKCDAPVNGSSLEFNAATCERVMGD